MINITDNLKILAFWGLIKKFYGEIFVESLNEYWKDAYVRFQKREEQLQDALKQEVERQDRLEEFNEMKLDLMTILQTRKYEKLTNEITDDKGNKEIVEYLGINDAPFNKSSFIDGEAVLEFLERDGAKEVICNMYSEISMKTPEGESPLIAFIVDSGLFNPCYRLDENNKPYYDEELQIEVLQAIDKALYNKDLSADKQISFTAFYGQFSKEIVLDKETIVRDFAEEDLKGLTESLGFTIKDDIDFGFKRNFLYKDNDTKEKHNLLRKNRDKANKDFKDVEKEFGRLLAKSGVETFEKDALAKLNIDLKKINRKYDLGNLGTGFDVKKVFDEDGNNLWDDIRETLEKQGAFGGDLDGKDLIKKEKEIKKSFESLLVTNDRVEKAQKELSVFRVDAKEKGLMVNADNLRYDLQGSILNVANSNIVDVLVNRDKLTAPMKKLLNRILSVNGDRLNDELSSIVDDEKYTEGSLLFNQTLLSGLNGLIVDLAEKGVLGLEEKEQKDLVNELYSFRGKSENKIINKLTRKFPNLFGRFYKKSVFDKSGNYTSAVSNLEDGKTAIGLHRYKHGVGMLWSEENRKDFINKYLPFYKDIPKEVRDDKHLLKLVSATNQYNKDKEDGVFKEDNIGKKERIDGLNDLKRSAKISVEHKLGKRVSEAEFENIFTSVRDYDYFAQTYTANFSKAIKDGIINKKIPTEDELYKGWKIYDKMPNGLKQVVMGFVNSVNFYQGKDSKIETGDRYLIQENLINVVKYASNKGVMTQDEYDYFMAKVDNLSIKRMFEIKEGKYTDHNLTDKQLKELQAIPKLDTNTYYKGREVYENDKSFMKTFKQYKKFIGMNLGALITPKEFNSFEIDNKAKAEIKRMAEEKANQNSNVKDTERKDDIFNSMIN